MICSMRLRGIVFGRIKGSLYFTWIITSKNVDFGYDWEVYPAFRWALYPETRDIFRYTDIPQNL